MSRIGKQLTSVSSGVEVKLEGTLSRFKKESLVKNSDTKVNVNAEIRDDQALFSPKGEDKQSRAYWGTCRVLTYNVIAGLTEGFSKALGINGVGYKAALKGKVLELSFGFSCPTNYGVPAGIEISVDKSNVIARGSDKQVIGQVAAQTREFGPPESYKGKGMRYANECITRKAGKASKR